MIYLRNTSRIALWLEDPRTGIKRKVEPDELARVTTELAELTLQAQPGTWELVKPIAPPPT